MAYEDLKRRVTRLYPSKEGIQAILPDWLQDDDYIAPVASPDEKIIVPSGYLALQEDGSVKWVP